MQLPSGGQSALVLHSPGACPAPPPAPLDVLEEPVAVVALVACVEDPVCVPPPDPVVVTSLLQAARTSVQNSAWWPFMSIRRSYLPQRGASKPLRSRLELTDLATKGFALRSDAPSETWAR